MYYTTFNEIRIVKSAYSISTGPLLDTAVHDEKSNLFNLPNYNGSHDKKSVNLTDAVKLGINLTSVVLVLSLKKTFIHRIKVEIKLLKWYIFRFITKIFETVILGM